jgi:hypothetical protein
MEISTANQPPQVFDNKDMYNRIYIYYTTTCTTATNSWFLELPISIFECVCTIRIYIYLCCVVVSNYFLRAFFWDMPGCHANWVSPEGLWNRRNWKTIYLIKLLVAPDHLSGFGCYSKIFRKVFVFLSPRDGSKPTGGWPSINPRVWCSASEPRPVPVAAGFLEVHGPTIDAGLAGAFQARVCARGETVSLREAKIADWEIPLYFY